jgi:hypothetical protein
MAVDMNAVNSSIDPTSALVAEQFSHAVDLLRATITSQEKDITTLKTQAQDFENRIRDLTTAVVQFKLLAALATGGGALSIIALIKTLISP